MNKVGVVSLVAVRERERERGLYFNEINNNKININNKIAINLKMEKFRFYIVIFFVVFKFKETKDMKININES